ncbi:cupin domain-containing protein [Octadecabacter sp.]|jgi:quercetin dioxygenase-like cupin family protein|nr:cupin domain-containing protein [Octadecabacter sp.]MDC1500230.1 cupin domain-containing protein [Octadecabacter sp.]
MNTAILKPDELPVNDRGNGARTIPLVTRKCGSTSMINGITAFDPGAKIGVHFHNCEESVMILEGEAIAEIDGVRHLLKAGDTTWIPSNMPHRFLNESSSLMRIFWTYADVNASRTMVESGIEQTIDEEHAKAKQI